MGDREATVAERVPTCVPTSRGPDLAGICGPNDGQFNRSAKMQILYQECVLHL